MIDALDKEPEAHVKALHRSCWDCPTMCFWQNLETIVSDCIGLAITNDRLPDDGIDGRRDRGILVWQRYTVHPRALCCLYLMQVMHQLLDKDLYKSHRNGAGLPALVGEISLEDQREAIPVARATVGEENIVRPAESEDSSALDEDNKDWESKLRCTVFKPRRRHSNHLAGGIDSSAPETTSSDNSPTLIRRFPRLGAGAKGNEADSASSGDSSSDSRDSSFRRDDDLSQCVPAPPRAVVPAPAPAAVPVVDSLARSSTPCARNGKRNAKKSPTEPNQPSEAMAHFMFELAKSILVKAGGDVSNALFQPVAGQQLGLPHRELHMCAYQIGLYALGIQNCVSQNWQSRTYSSHVSWITNQAMELGFEAVNFLIDTWESHLTPSEVAVLADKASRSSDLQMVREAAELAQSVLSHSSALNPAEIQRALAQCKEQDGPMLEQALLAVEASARGGGVCPEALFDVARKWYDLFAEATGELPLLANAAEDGHNPAVFSNNHLDHPALHPHQNLMPLAYQPHLQHHPQYSYHHHYAPNPAAVLAVLRHHHPYVQHHGLLQQQPQRHPMNPYYQQMQLGMLIPGGMPAVVRPPMHRFAHPHPSLSGIPGLNGLVMPPTPAAASGSISPAVLQYLTSAYRVGMLAMDTLARRLPDGHVNKYSRAPPHAESIKWLVAVSFRLGSQSLLEMCRAVENTVSSPSMLWEIARAAALFLADSEFPHREMLDADPGTRAAFQQLLLDKYLRVQAVQTLIKKSTQMFNLCLRQKLLYIAPADYEDFLSTVEEARKVYSQLANVNWSFQFHNLLTEIREQLAGKRDLLQRLNAITGQHLVPSNVNGHP
ncbi:zinc finger SWIM domain-containing protein 8-like [Paramacrobiotus metropolitanus]|uniref:zinc finger SWIM domain-containing protein 8-like n=1 Tax=Paramacrobiotus metropolitanus TaxID=2943436 RepID=UPI0024463F72|nr:zinc finger SWIM domain-containing protein 8-like [Paramacrobiotus metropolitanus]